ncbi:helix-turn-helix domain-containing protein [Hymenobacter sp. DG25A]|uniref:helix-turn-helix domain-containing protein n=1 Tax=Hymenobacter sp. DG25A TaxID=1385663 RepID=UPI0006BD3231|nr:hypothetical protein AM218_08965 [Hymenobacter sp. DG25A]
MQNPMILSDRDSIRELLRNLLIELLPTAPAATDATASELLTMAEACQEFGVSKTTLTQWRKSGIVPFIRLGRRVLFERGKVLEAGRSHTKYTRLKG